MLRFLPMLDLRRVRLADLPRDALAGLIVALVSVPQGIAYAYIAGLPPVVGLYACVVPVVIGSLFRSSPFVITGPSNALSLLVGATVVGTADDPMQAALGLAFIAGLMQVAAGLLRAGALVDYLSAPVVRGYITGVAVLIAVGQLPTITASPGARGSLVNQLQAWGAGLADLSPSSVGLALATAALIVLLRKIHPRMPALVLGVATATLLSWLGGLEAAGMRTVGTVAPIDPGLPPLTMPTWASLGHLVVPGAAVAMLSLLEASAVARDVGDRTGRRLQPSVEFVGQGLANITAAFTGGYPISGSPSRTAVGVDAGARSRLSGVISGLVMLLVVVFAGPAVERVPLAALSGVLLVVARGLLEIGGIRTILASRGGDRLGFLVTLLGTWTLPLDMAIYLGIAISIVMFLRQVSHLVVREMAFDSQGELREVTKKRKASVRRCTAVRILNVQGALFFASAGELSEAIDKAAGPGIRVVVVRLRRTQALDLTAADALARAHVRLERKGVKLLVVGLRPRTYAYLEQVGITERLQGALFKADDGWFQAMEAALERSARSIRGHACADPCPVEEWLTTRHPPASATA